MPETIDWPMHPGPSPRRSFILLIADRCPYLASAAAPPSPSGSTFCGSARSAIGRSSGRPGPGMGNFRGLRGGYIPDSLWRISRAPAQLTPPTCPTTHTIFSPAGRSNCRWRRRCTSSLRSRVSLLIAVATGVAMEAEWPTLALYWYAPHAADSRHRSYLRPAADFYLFTLPAWQLIAGWLLTLAVHRAAFLPRCFCWSAGGARASAGGLAARSLPWRGLSIAGGFLLLVLLCMSMSAASSCCLSITRSSTESATPTRT